jgi:preprotein translocase subunit YajC
VSQIATWVPVLAAAKPKTSGSSVFFLVILVLFGLVYWFVLRPQQAKARKARDLGTSFEVGDEIVTVGGIVGTILETEGDRVTILSGGDNGQDVLPTRLVLVRQAIARKVDPAVAPVAAHDDDLDDDHGTAQGSTAGGDEQASSAPAGGGGDGATGGTGDDGSDDDGDNGGPGTGRRGRR